MCVCVRVCVCVCSCIPSTCSILHCIDMRSSRGVCHIHTYISIPAVSCPPGSYQTYSVEYLSSSVSLTYPTCQLCPLGHYQPNPEQDSCLPCPPGHFGSYLGQPYCEVCPDNHYQDKVGQLACKSCPKGTSYNATEEGATDVTQCTSFSPVSSLHLCLMSCTIFSYVHACTYFIVCVHANVCVYVSEYCTVYIMIFHEYSDLQHTDMYIRT